MSLGETLNGGRFAVSGRPGQQQAPFDRQALRLQHFALADRSGDKIEFLLGALVRNDVAPIPFGDARAHRPQVPVHEYDAVLERIGVPQQRTHHRHDLRLIGLPIDEADAVSPAHGRGARGHFKDKHEMGAIAGQSSPKRRAQREDFEFAVDIQRHLAGAGVWVYSLLLGVAHPDNFREVRPIRRLDQASAQKRERCVVGRQAQKGWRAVATENAKQSRIMDLRRDGLFGPLVQVDNRSQRSREWLPRGCSPAFHRAATARRRRIRRRDV
jgi:hypothetical protein